MSELLIQVLAQILGAVALALATLVVRRVLAT